MNLPNSKQQAIETTLEKIEVLRQQLQHLVEEKKGQLSDPDVIQLSSEMDELIVRYQRGLK